MIVGDLMQDNYIGRDVDILRDLFIDRDRQLIQQIQLSKRIRKDSWYLQSGVTTGRYGVKRSVMIEVSGRSCGGLDYQVK